MSESCNPEPQVNPESQPGSATVLIGTALGGAFFVQAQGLVGVNVDARTNGSSYVFAVTVSYRLHGAIWRSLVAASGELEVAYNLAREVAYALAGKGDSTFSPDYDADMIESTAWFSAHHWGGEDVSLRR